MLDLLDESYFGASNFSVEFGDGNPRWLKVSFIPNGNFSFKIDGTGLGTAFYQSSAAPGVEFLRPDTHMERSFDDCARRIPDWIQRIKEEIIDSSPLNRELQLVRKQLEERIDYLGEKQDDYFTREEATQLAERLNEFSNKLTELCPTNDELKSVISNLKAKLEVLAAATESVNKGTWLRMAGSRILKAAKAVMGSKEGREFALEAAKKVLLDGPK
ncbi:hypothetical protein [Aquabacterium sp. OR-4]|uniref:hypothetical protein n=1 Tax=Aquabacterium sp. OR-4 TaxID=2978127 RepID=UPI0021B31CCC|nr:hypothetical protein [Aquabacterium sp. OR-4]MDT7836922.1 hypothetical protein [Aquabacterium sp. OR-4]